MLSYLPLTPVSEARLRATFHARRSLDGLQQTDVEGMLDLYENLVASVETQSCNHGHSGTVLKGDAWRSCCGISYEYVNDIYYRDALQQILDAATQVMSPGMAERLVRIDDRLYNLSSIRAPSARASGGARVSRAASLPEPLRPLRSAARGLCGGPWGSSPDRGVRCGATVRGAPGVPAVGLAAC